MTHHRLAAATMASIATCLIGGPALATKKLPYAEVKVDLAEAFKPDAAFETMRKKLTDAVAKKDSAALFALIGPTFVWTYQSGPTELFDMGRGPLDNFKVVFGFRAAGADQDGGVDDGPYWEALQELASETSYYQVPEAGNLVCTPILAGFADDEAEEKAREKLETEDDPVEWYFTLGNTDVMKSPTDKGQPMAKVGAVALPVLGSHPPVVEGAAPVPPTHIEVLLPSGKSGWIAKSAARPMSSSRLCFAKTPAGEWKIASYDQVE